MTLQDKIVLITGASSGIGQATAIAFAKEGAFVIAHYHSNTTGINQTMQEILNLGKQGFMIQADLSDDEEVDKMFLQINKKFGKLHVLVNNAGGNEGGKDQLDSESWYDTFQIDLFAVVRSCKNARDIFKKSLNKIINVSSIYGVDRFGSQDMIAYNASKAALNSLTRNLAKSMAPKVLVNAVAPGYVETPSWGSMSGFTKRKYGGEQLINRFVQPGEVADSIVFLTKNDAMCGEILVIDGGLSLKRVN